MYADFQEYYGINLERVLTGDDTSYSITYISILATQLPQTSRTYVSENADMGWDVDTLILSDIANSLRTLVATKQKKFTKPQYILPPSLRDEKKERKLEGEVMTREELDKILAMKRGD